MNRLVAAVTVALAMAESAAWAGSNDLRLDARDPAGNGFLFRCTVAEVDPCPAFAPRNDRFRALSSQLSMVLAPRLSGPADTLGHAGFHVSAGWGGSFVSGEAPYWGVRGEGVPSETGGNLLQTLQLDLRKGLPWSFEVGAQLQWLIDSALLAPGLQLRWALEKSRDLPYLPDFSVRAAVSHMVGHRDLRLSVAAAEAIVSKSIGVFGMLNLSPYVGWAVLFPIASAGPVDPTPGRLVGDPGAPDAEANLTFEPIDFGELVNQRLTLGLRVLASIVEVGVQGEFQVFGEVEEVFALSARLGFTL